MNILVIGATSAIAKATARFYADQKTNTLFLVARNQKELETFTQDLTVRGAENIHATIVDLVHEEAYEEWIGKAFDTMGSVDIVLVAHGILGDQKTCEQDVTKMKQMLEVNGISSMAMITIIANKLERQGSGTIAYISSVAGDRGRASNYVYGASKAMVNTFLQGLHVRMSRVGVNVLTIKPGFVDTPMTADFDKGSPLWAQPEDIARGIAKAIEKRKSCVYLPWFWSFIMRIIIHIPGPIFKKLNL